MEQQYQQQPAAQQPAATPGEQPQKHQGARNFFFYFLCFVLLYIVSISLGGVLFQIINKSFPQVGQYYRGMFNASLLRYNLSSLIIGTPFFFWLSSKIYRDEQHTEAMLLSGVRSFLTYLTLVVAALIVIGDLIYLVYSLLGGETTARFVLKATVVLMISGAIFYYYLTDVKRARKGAADAIPHALPRIYFIASLVIICVGIVSAFFFIESPLTQRLRAQDTTRISNLQEIKSAVDNYAYSNRALPASLTVLRLREGISADPVTKAPYTYQVVDQTKYKLCATFETSNRDAAATQQGYYDVYGNMWLHDKGQTCFDEANPYTATKAVPPVPAIEYPTTFQGFSNQ